jgi:hypothetical protein
MAKLPKRHHYLPQFYLKGFSQDTSHLHIFDKKTTDKESQFRYQTTEKIAYENDLYTYRTKSLKKATLEGFFSQIEGLAKRVIVKLDKKQDITPLERGHLALFIALLWFRTPTWKTETLGLQGELTEKMIRMNYHLPQQKELMREFFQKEGKDFTEKELDDHIDFAVNPKRSKIVITFPPEHWIKQMLTLANDVYIYLAHCGWEVKHAEKKYAFLTSDNPVLLIPSEEPHPFYGFGLLTPGVKKTIPLTANMYLAMHEPQEELLLFHTIATKEFCRDANTWTLRNADRLVFSPVLGKMEKMIKTTPDLAKPRGKKYRVS